MSEINYRFRSFVYKIPEFVHHNKSYKVVVKKGGESNYPVLGRKDPEYQNKGGETI